MSDTPDPAARSVERRSDEPAARRTRASPAPPGSPAARRHGPRRPRGRRAQTRIGIRELRQHASVYVDLAEKGYTIDITNRGRLVAQIVPVREPDSPLERLIAAGIIEPAEEAGGLADIDPYPARGGARAGGGAGPGRHPADRERGAQCATAGGGRVIYLDSSALVKLAVTEPESAALAAWLAERAGQPLVSSVLHRAEVPRAVWRAEPGALPRSYRLIRRIARVALTPGILDDSATLPPQALSPAHAIHLASALAVRRDLTAFVAYDEALLAAAAKAGLPVASPG